MPTILRYSAMRFQIYVDDHEPPHVHVKLPGGRVTVFLVERSRTVYVRRVRGPLRDHDLAHISAIVEEHFDTLLTAWNKIHR
ncbi:MAG: DUF4160 domain-containing protein [Candidatus Eremiobacteraeota bacterium]|nr:DUF4160 domain-containing protein [Candidatus Eremiobacteraeota bacterium]